MESRYTISELVLNIGTRWNLTVNPATLQGTHCAGPRDDLRLCTEENCYVILSYKIVQSGRFVAAVKRNSHDIRQNVGIHLLECKES